MFIYTDTITFIGIKNGVCIRRHRFAVLFFGNSVEGLFSLLYNYAIVGEHLGGHYTVYVGVLRVIYGKTVLLNKASRLAL